MTIAAWLYQISDGGGGLGRVNQSSRWEWLTQLSLMRFRATRWATDGVWTYPRTLNVWRHDLVTYSYASDTNDPVIYVNGVSVAPTESVAPAGAVGVATGDFVIGNNGGAGTGTRNFDGRIADMTIWNRELSASEAKTVYARGAWAVPHGRVLYAPLWGIGASEPNYFGSGDLQLAVNGTALGDHAPYPMPFRMRRPALPYAVVAAAAARPTFRVVGMIG